MGGLCQPGVVPDGLFLRGVPWPSGQLMRWREAVKSSHRLGPSDLELSGSNHHTAKSYLVHHR